MEQPLSHRFQRQTIWACMADNHDYFEELEFQLKKEQSYYHYAKQRIEEIEKLLKKGQSPSYVDLLTTEKEGLVEDIAIIEKDHAQLVSAYRGMEELNRIKQLVEGLERTEINGPKTFLECFIPSFFILGINFQYSQKISVFSYISIAAILLFFTDFSPLKNWKQHRVYYISAISFWALSGILVGILLALYLVRLFPHLASYHF